MLPGWFTVAYQPERQAKWDEIRKSLMDRSDPSTQASALEQLVLLSYTESIPPHLLMPVIQYTATTHDHRVIKLLLMFLENCETRDAMGQLRPEFILIGDALRNFLLHPNEYVRGAVLRFLYKVNDPELLRQVLTPILLNLKYNDEYVKRHASVLVGRLARDVPGFAADVADSISKPFPLRRISEFLLRCSTPRTRRTPRTLRI
jgi:coatomer subunit beta